MQITMLILLAMLVPAAALADAQPKKPAKTEVTKPKRRPNSETFAGSCYAFTPKSMAPIKYIGMDVPDARTGGFFTEVYASGDGDKGWVRRFYCTTEGIRFSCSADDDGGLFRFLIKGPRATLEIEAMVLRDANDETITLQPASGKKMKLTLPKVDCE
jgi:hypothetical protein